MSLMPDGLTVNGGAVNSSSPLSHTCQVPQRSNILPIPGLALPPPGSAQLEHPLSVLAVFSCDKSSFFAIFNLLCSLPQPLLIFLFCCLIDFHVGFIFRKL